LLHLVPQTFQFKQKTGKTEKTVGNHSFFFKS